MLNKINITCLLHIHTKYVKEFLRLNYCKMKYCDLIMIQIPVKLLCEIRSKAWLKLVRVLFTKHHQNITHF